MFPFLNVFAQQQTHNWYFGDRSGLRFGGPQPLPVTASGMNTAEGSASISSPEGDLLFYTNGVYIWNRRHEIMENGGELFGNASSTQSSLIVPHPGNDSLYYVFSVDNHGGPRGVTYHLVNMNANGGLGRVISRNNTLATGAAEKITGIHKCDNKEAWVVIRKWNAAQFFTFEITAAGLNTDPVISNVQETISGDSWGTLGSMKISPDSRLLAAAHGWAMNRIELCRFNRSTGELTPFGKISVTPPGYNGFETGPYGIEFSPDSRFLYVYCSYGTGNSQLYQFDCSLPDIASIQQSRVLIANLPYPFAGSLQLGPDRQIYVTNNFDSSLSLITRPNQAGAASAFQFAAVKLARPCALGLPNFLQSYLDPAYFRPDFSATDCRTGNLRFALSTVPDLISVQWNFGDPASGAANTSSLLQPEHNYPSSGFYTVTAVVTRPCSVDTIRKKVYAGTLAFTISAPPNGCHGDTVRLTVADYPGLTYRWNTGDRGSQLAVSSGGKYVVSTDAGCRFSDSVDLRFYAKPVFSLGPDREICTDELFVLDPGLGTGQFRWSTGSDSAQLRGRGPGQYWLRVQTPGTTCFSTDTVQLRDRPFPAFDLGRDTLICETEVLWLRTGLRGVNLLWQDGRSDTDYKVTGPGTYILKAYNNCTVKWDTLRVSYKICPMGIPNAFTPNGDGRNDRFRVKYGTNITEFRLQVFNRFGMRVYEGREQTEGWDGRLGGKAQPAGTYVWVLYYKDGLSQQPVYLRGTVNLVR